MIFSIGTFLAFVLPVFGNSYDLDALTDSLLREVIPRVRGDPTSEDYGFPDLDQLSADYPLEMRRDAILEKEPSIRDKEYLEHSSLFGHKVSSNVEGGLGEGFQRLRPDGPMGAMVFGKIDGALPAYCNPPNPCPIGYTADDGCLEKFQNTATYSRVYQASQECICDSEHMFDCSGSSQEKEIDILARTFENEGIAEDALDKLIKVMEVPNPFLEGEKLPVVAKKTPKSSIK